MVVEDELSLQETLAYNLKKQGYEVIAVGDGKTAVDEARRTAPDLIVLDLMLPVLDGFEVCRILRKESSVPILILTARDDEIDRVLGLEIGADDYLTKPFSMREFLARVKAQLRRARLMREEIQPERIRAAAMTFGNLEIDQARGEIRLSGEPLSLKPKEYELLVFFGRNRGQLLTRELILERVWGWDFSGGTRTVDVHVRWLREKIETDPANPTRIITVRGSGYRFEG